MSRAGAGPLAVLAGGFLAAAGGAASWLERDATREVGGVAVGAVETMSGTAFAPLLLPVGLLAVLIGFAGLFTRGVARRGTAVATCALGLGLVWLAAQGVVRANAAEGALTAAPWIALLGAAVVAVGGLVGMRPTRADEPLLDERYTVEGAAAEDAEWELAAEEPPEAAS